jgi:hypothetical protein
MMLFSGQSFVLESLDSPLTEAIKQQLTQMAEDALRINPKNVDPLVGESLYLYYLWFFFISKHIISFSLATF